jgi:chaperonin cofactor prefoldin
MQSELVAVLAEANRAITSVVTRWSENSAGPEANLSSTELEALSQKLTQVAKLLGQVLPTPSKEQALQTAISEYVDNLEKLKAVLGRAMDVLGKRRDRLKKNLENLNSAQAWVKTFRATNCT